MTPRELEILLNIYYSPVWQENNGLRDKFVNYLVANGVADIKISPLPAGSNATNLVLTEKGVAWVKEILSTPIPKQAWIGRDGSIINTD